MQVQFNLAGQNMIVPLAEQKKISCRRENKSQSIKDEGEGQSLMIDVEYNLALWKRKEQGWLYQMYQKFWERNRMIAGVELLE